MGLIKGDTRSSDYGSLTVGLCRDILGYIGLNREVAIGPKALTPI